MSFSRGWDPLRPDDYGPLWEHVVLEYLQAKGHDWTIRYWRDRAGREIDFVVVKDQEHVDAIECKWDPSHFDPSALEIFRSYYPNGTNFLICPLSSRGFLKRFGDREVLYATRQTGSFMRKISTGESCAHEKESGTFNSLWRPLENLENLKRC
ncbi:MAG: DUF4143 domain-containing protein [Candidatus Moduliflexus flocculans]|nr:DUF4143 domain-containing protein [Candidatus Moduliflexus flocculans]